MTTNKLKNNENFNISEGNVKENNIFPNDNVKENNINVANNVAQRNSQDLTEQWKRGKLPFGHYYIKDINDEIFADSYTNNGFINGFEDFFDGEISEVLAPVPSYEEWQEYVEANESMFSVVKMLNKDNYQLEKDIDKLKQLLKECRGLMNMSKDWAYTSVTEKLLSKIDEALR